MDDLAPLEFPFEPDEMDAPGLLAEHEPNELFRLILAVDLLVPCQTGDVAVDGGVLLGRQPIEAAQFAFGRGCTRGRQIR